MPKQAIHFHILAIVYAVKLSNEQEYVFQQSCVQCPLCVYMTLRQQFVPEDVHDASFHSKCNETQTLWVKLHNFLYLISYISVFVMLLLCRWRTNNVISRGIGGHGLTSTIP